MLRTLAFHRARRRSGAVLIVVLAMLVLFAVLGLSFVLYSEAQMTAARNQKESVNKETEPNPQLSAEMYLGGIVYGKGNTGDDLMNPIGGHSVAEAKYGYAGSLLPYSATPMQAEPVGFTFNGITDSRQIVRFTWDTGTNSVFDPQRFYNGVALRNNPTAALVGTYQGKNYPFTYPDRHDFYLAQMDPATGRIVVPSFHRDDLGSWDPNSGAANYFETKVGGKFLTLRPRVADGHVNFPPVPPNPDGSYTGDVANMKMITGSQRNDSYWMDAGGPVLKWRGKFYKAMVAPLVLDLNGRVNLSTAGNLKNLPYTATAPHGSNHGLGAWEVNPMQLGLTAADLQAIVQKRYGKTAADYTPQADPYTTATSTARVNRGRMAPLYAPLDVDGTGSLANDGAFALPAAAAYSSFPTYNHPLVVAPPYRYEPNPTDLTNALANHPAQNNPLLYPRTPATGQAGGFGHDDLIKLYARYSDPKNRQAATTSVPNPTSVPAVTTLATNNALRAATTTFSTTQRWAGVGVTAALSTAPGATFATTLGPVDVNRPLPDFRKNTALPLSPVNIWDATVGAEQPYFAAAVSARQQLARDIFVRLCARYGLINGTSAVYYADTGVVNVLAPIADASYPSFAAFAQLAVNMVDFLDYDDIATTFVWRPFTPTAADPNLDANNFAAAEMPSRVAFGTELPRLVLNEVYSCIENDRNDRGNGNGNMNGRANGPMRRQYWVELHNPTPPESAASAARSDLGAARLRYHPASTVLPNPVGGTMAPPLDYNPYRIEIAVVRTPGAGQPPTQPYTAAITAAGNGAVAGDTAALFGATADVRVRIDDYSPAPASPPALMNDERWVVRPATGPSGPDAGNLGYFLLGPEARFPTVPANGTNPSLTLPDAGNGVPATPANTLEFSTTGAPPQGNDITTEVAKASVVILRRLLNPYLRPNDPATTGGTYPYNAAFPLNPYITVDVIENVPTRDRVGRVNNGNGNGMGGRPQSNSPTVGRVHPYAAAPVYGTMPAATAGVQDQNPAIAGAPPHTLFSVNAPSDNSRPTATPAYGFEWLVHLDREAVSLPELAHVSWTNPTALTQTFFNAMGAYHSNSAINLPLTSRWLTDCAGLLDTAPRLPGAALGGREAGRVNPNTAAHQSILNAVLDPQAGNGFAATNPTLATTAWANSIVTAVAPGGTRVVRTPNGTPRATVHEVGVTGAGTEDHPFVWGSGNWPATSADGLLDRAVSSGPVSPTNPLVFGNAAATGNHPYFQYEPMQKLWNNLTPVSDSFLVVMTVGFFEVENAGPWTVTNQPQFGRELFDKVPGDLRAQFAGVIDRSNLAVADPATPTTPAANSPFQTKLTTDVIGGNTRLTVEAAFVAAGGLLPDGSTAAADTAVLYGDGTRRYLSVTAGTSLRVGYGDNLTNTGDGEWVTVNTVTQRTTLTASGTVNVAGEVTVTLGGGLTRYHGAGAIVSDAVFGNPGPQTGVTLAQLQQRGLVPYFTRLDP